MTIPEYESRTYEELSKEFREKTSRAVELIRLMYNRLTLVDHVPHKLAVRKIIDDHSHIRGYSPRNISRNLPRDNPIIPRRVRPKCLNSIPTNNSSALKLSCTKLPDELDRHQSQNDEHENLFMNYNKVSNKNEESIKAIPRRTTMVATNKISKGLTFRIPKEKYEIVRIAMADSNEFIRVIFDWSFEFDHAESDVVKSRI